MAVAEQVIAVQAKASPFDRVRAFAHSVKKDLTRNKYIYLMLAPVVGYYLIFYYGPMYGAQIAFRDYEPALGITGSEWVGWENFKEFFTSPFFPRLIRNTVSINILDLVAWLPSAHHPGTGAQ